MITFKKTRVVFIIVHKSDIQPRLIIEFVGSGLFYFLVKKMKFDSVTAFAASIASTYILKKC